MPFQITSAQIQECLSGAYLPGRVAFSDGQAVDESRLRCAAVLMPLVWKATEWHLLLTRRTEIVESHKGQVSFPGGACDPGESLEQTALREAHEEIGLHPEHVQILGCLDQLLLLSGYRVTPVVGVIPDAYPFRIEQREVERIFTIPLDWLCDARHFREQSFTPQGVRRPIPVIIYDEYAGELLWGASARMTHHFLQVIGLMPV